MDNIISELNSKETKRKLAGIASLKPVIESTIGEYSTETLTALAHCIKDNNAKVCIGSLECLQILAQKEGEKLRSFLAFLVASLIERLGDGKSVVREKCLELVMEIINIVGIVGIMEKLQPAFCHKNYRVREQVAFCLSKVSCWNTERALLDKLIPKILDLLEDSNPDVREAAVVAIESIYRQIGRGLLDTLQQKKIRPLQMRQLQERLKLQDSCPAVIKPSYNIIRATPAPSLHNFLPSKPVTEALIPIRVDNEKQLIKEMESINHNLRSSDDWSCRVEALRTLQRLALGNAKTTECFIAQIKKMEKIIRVQITDLRSSVSKEACQLISCLAQELGDAFEPLAELFIDSLLKLTIITISVINQSGDTSIRKIIENTRIGYPRLIPKFVDGSKSRNQITRACCVSYLASIYDTWSHTCIEKYLTQLIELLPSVLSDAQNAVRISARQCYRSFARRFPTQARIVLEKLDLSIQRSLNDDEIAQEHHHQQQQQQQHLPKRSLIPLRQEQLSCIDIPSKKHTSSSITSSNKQLSEPATRLISRVSGSMSKQIPAEQSGYQRRTEIGSPQSSGIEKMLITPSISNYGARRIEIARAHSGSHGFIEPTPIANINNNNTLPQRVAQTRACEIISTSNNDFHPPLDGQFSGSIHLEGAKRIVVREQENTNRNKAKPVVPAIGNPVRIFQSKDYDECIEKDIKTNQKGGTEFVSIVMLLDETNDSLWSKRLAAFDQLCKLMKDSSRVTEIRLHSENLLNAIINRLLDGHHKVMQSVLRTLSAFIALLPQVAENSLVNIFPKIFNKLLDTKESIRLSAKNVLDTIKRTYDASILLSVLLLKTTESSLGNQFKVKVVVLEFFLELIPSAQTYLKNVTHMRQFLLKTTQQYLDKNIQLRTIATNNITLLHKHYPEEVEKCLQDMPNQIQSSLSKIIQLQMPEQECIIEEEEGKENEKEKEKEEKELEQNEKDKEISFYGEENFKEQIEPLNISKISFAEPIEHANQNEFLIQEDLNNLEDYRSEAESITDQEEYRNQEENRSKEETYNSLNISNIEDCSSNISTNLDEFSDSIAFSNQNEVPSNVEAKTFHELSNQTNDDELPTKELKWEAEDTKKESNYTNHVTVSQKEYQRSYIIKILEDLYEGKGSKKQDQALNELISISENAQADLLDDHFGQILFSLLEILNVHRDSSRCQLAIYCIRCFIKNQPHYILDYLDTVVVKLLRCHRTHPGVVEYAAEKALLDLAERVNASALISVIIPLVATMDVPELPASLQLLACVIKTSDSISIQEHLNDILGPLYKAFNHVSASVRKNVVSCLVELHYQLGVAFFPYLEHLTRCQKEVVNIYISKAKQKRPFAAVS